MITDTRAVSGVLGVVLLFSIIIAGMVITVAIGTTALDQTKGELGASRAEKTLTQLDSKSAVVALGQSNHQGVPLPADETAEYDVHDTSGWMNVTIKNTTDGTVTSVVNVTLGAVVYENTEATLAYQGGGVWKKSEGGATMVSPPEFHWRNATLTLPLITVDGSAERGNTVQISRSGPTVRRYPNATLDRNFTNPLEDGKVNVTVQSEYYRAWGRYFEQRTDGDVTYDHSRETATIVLTVPADDREVENAVFGTSESGNIKVTGTGARTDSYDSRNGTYATTKSADGTLKLAGDITVSGNAVVCGTIEAGGSATVNSGNGDSCPVGTHNQQYVVHGDVNWTTSEDVKDPSQTVEGDVTRIDGIDSRTQINTHVNATVSDVESDNDNAGTIADDEVIDESGTLSAGRYYVDRVDLDGETLIVDTTDGKVTIAVEDYVYLDDSAVDVTGGHQVRIYVKGEDGKSLNPGGGFSSGEYHFFAEDSDTLMNSPDNSTQFWVYGNDYMWSGIQKGASSSQVRGVIYAPGGTTGTGRFEIRQSELFGAAVTANAVFHNKGSVHFDAALAHERALPQDASVVKITYLHISVNPITVTAS